MEKDIIISGKKLSNNKGWWALIDTEHKKIVIAEDTDLLLGVFSIQNEFFIFNEGTSFDRTISIYDIHSNFISKLKAYGNNPVLINRSKNKIAINVLTNKMFELGIDDINKARIGIEIYDITNGQIEKLYPVVDENYILESFNSELIYKTSKVNIEIKI